MDAQELPPSEYRTNVFAQIAIYDENYNTYMNNCAGNSANYTPSVECAMPSAVFHFTVKGIGEQIEKAISGGM